MRMLLTGFCIGVRRGEKILSERKYSLTDLFAFARIPCSLLQG
jgi:hypothetical protein